MPVNNDDLEFKLRRSIAIVKEQKMAKKKAATNKERASVSRERRLALALRALLDAIEDGGDAWLPSTRQDAVTLLNGLGYSTLEGIPRRVTKLNEQLTAAVAASDGKEIARLGLELQRAQEGKPPVVVKTEKAKTAEA
jgi:hypothetical protein